MEWSEFLSENRLQLGVGALGLALMGLGAWQAGIASKGLEPEIVETSFNSEESTLVVIDVSGAVLQPGVFRLPSTARVADALVAAGGLNAEADRSFVSRFINQAQVVEDGMKLFIPTVGEAIPVADGGDGQVNLRTQAGSNTINVNTATLSQLDSLWGVGEARAQQIIDNRPYGSVEELVSKAKLPQNVLDNNEGKVSVY